eukprot:3972555-Prymnesium_polylepis.1
MALLDGGAFIGSLHPIHDIAPMGIAACRSCPSMAGGKCTFECEANKAKMEKLKQVRDKRVHRSNQRAAKEAEDGECRLS